MDKNVKRMFFTSMLLVLLVGVTAISASDVSDDTTAIEDTSEKIAPTDVATATSDNSVETTKTIEKEDKNLKTATKTVEVNNYNELTTTMNNAVNDADNDEYIINLNEGTYQITSRIELAKGSNTPIITINANNQTLSGNKATRRVVFRNNCNVTINDAIITHRISAGGWEYDSSLGQQIYYSSNLTLNKVSVNNDISIDNNLSSITFKNSTIDSAVENEGILIIDDDCILGSSFTVSGSGVIVANDTNIIYPYTNVFNGNNSLNNLTIDKIITNNGNLTLNNITINSKIINNGKLIISDDTIFDINCIIDGIGEIEINDTSKIIEYLTTYNGDYTLRNKNITSDKINLGNLTIINCTIYNNINNKENSNLNIINSSTYNTITNQENANTTLLNSEVYNTILNQENANLYIVDSDINAEITNYGNLTLTNSLINSTIDNYEIIVIDNKTGFTENTEIKYLGEIVIEDINRLLPYTSTIHGNYTITNTILDKTYNYLGNVTIENSNITSTENVNYGVLNIVNTNIQIDEESNWITNYGLITIDEQSTTTGTITNYGEVFTGSIHENYTYDPTYHIINNDTIKIYFDTTKGNVLGKFVNEGDTLDFQGTISGVTGLTSLVINKPVNIITSTNDGRIENFSTITYNNGASGSNVTGLYTYNTQFYVRNAHNMVFDNISNVVISKGIGWGVGQTSIRENSTNITVKNSYFYTKDNGGSSTFVFGWADNCTLVNSTIETDGNVGNLVYLTTYNVDVPSGTIANSNNQILNNIIIGPETPAAICWGIVLSGANNYIANNVIYYSGTGITNQWGSGITGVGEDNNETSLVTTENNTLHNNTHIKHKPQPELTIDTTTFTAGETATITATIRNATKIMTDINKGKVTFKVNGKTLKDANGKVIYAKLVNGTAQIENYLVPDDWTKDGTTIEAVYAGSTQCAKLTSEKTNLTVTPKELTLTTEDITAQAGSTVTLTAILSDNTINTGKVVFKINGKTVKDANGKVIYAKVVNGQVTVNYTIAESMKDGNYNITAVYTSPNSEKVTAEATLTLTKE